MFAVLLMSCISFGQEPASLSAQDLWDVYAKTVYPANVRLGAKMSDPVIYETKSDEDFIPASVTKMFTLAAVLSKLGRDFKFETTLTWIQSGNEARGVTLTGDGDPSLNAEVFQEFAAKLKESGVELIRGPIQVVASDPRFDEEVIPSGNLDENLIWCFGAQPASFNIDQNCALLAVTSLTSGSWFDPGVGHSIKVELEEGKANNFQIVREGDGYVITGFGNPKTFPVYLDMRVLRPIDRARSLMHMSLMGLGIQFTTDPGEMREIQNMSYTHYSAPMAELVQPIVKSSHNPPLEALQRYIGKKFGGAGALVLEGAKVIQDFLATSVTSPHRSITLVDGSGLSRSNFVNAAWIYDFLVQMKEKEYFDDFLAALAVGGKDGTLKRRWVGTEAEGKVFAKTGTLTGHANLAGYLTEQLIPFVLLNDYDGSKVSVSKVRNAQNRMVLHWFETMIPAPAATAASVGSKLWREPTMYMIGD